jgi:putative DNA primase/helicase
VVGKSCVFIQYCKKNAKILPEPVWYAMISNLALFEGGESAIHKLSRPYPAYSFEETQRKINHFHKSGAKPMTCRRIAEQGFLCPRLDSCKCNSPAGLAFFSMDMKDIRKQLAVCKVTNTPVDDVATARQFLGDYLFNIDTGLAETFINSEIKTKFGFKASDIKQLVSYHKELSHAFFAAQQSKRDKSGAELPPWYELTDRGSLRFMSGLLANHLSEKFHAFYCTEQYYYYQNGVYSFRADKDAKATVRTYLNPRDVTMNQINDAEGQWQLLIRKPVMEINPNPFIINAQNGLLHVLDGSFKGHEPGYYSTVQMKAKYDSEAKCPRFVEFLHSALDEPEIYLLQEIFGYFLVPITKAQKSFLLCGLPNVGKSTILTVLQEFLLGAENVSNIPLQSLSDRFQPAELFGKLANIYADLPTKKIDDAGMFKAVTGEDYITGERKHKDPFSFKPYARFMYSCNDIPRNYGDRSEAFYRRLIIIRFSKAVPDEKKDLQLAEKLSLERDGILLWAIEGLKRMIAANYQFSETDRTKAELMAYKIQNNSVLAFIDELCLAEPGAVCYRQELYDEYTGFCESTSLGRFSQPNFNSEIGKQRGIELAQEPITRRAIFKGVKLR